MVNRRWLNLSTCNTSANRRSQLLSPRGLRFPNSQDLSLPTSPHSLKKTTKNTQSRGGCSSSPHRSIEMTPWSHGSPLAGHLCGLSNIGRARGIWPDSTLLAVVVWLSLVEDSPLTIRVPTRIPTCLSDLRTAWQNRQVSMGNHYFYYDHQFFL